MIQSVQCRWCLTPIEAELSLSDGATCEALSGNFYCRSCNDSQTEEDKAEQAMEHARDMKQHEE